MIRASRVNERLYTGANLFAAVHLLLPLGGEILFGTLLGALLFANFGWAATGLRVAGFGRGHAFAHLWDK